MTKKLYARNQLAKAARVSGQNISTYLEFLGIKPVEYAIVAGKVYQSYDQAAFDAVVKWRKEKDTKDTPAAPAPVQEPLPLTVDVGPTRHLLTIISRLDVMSKALDHVTLTSMQTSRKLDELLDSLTAPSTNSAQGDLLNGAARDH